MGLDMYLYGSVYTNRYSNPAAFNQLQDLRLEKAWPVAPEAIEVKAQLAYWRKANAIHNWFVQTCQDGRDECQLTYVEMDHLKELVELCDQLLASRDEDKAREELPPTSGFFFGGTDIDEYYWQDLDDTRNQLSRILTSEAAKSHALSFYYQSSW